DWSAEQCNAVRDAFWKTGTALCPVHGLALGTLEAIPVVGSDQKAVRAMCPRCRAGYRIGPDTDPLRPFRRWTAREQADFLQPQEEWPLLCPVDGSLLEAAVRPTPAGGVGLALSCGRCGNHVQAS